MSNKNSKIEIRITFENKIGYLALLTSETMKLFGSTKTRITKDKNGKNVPHVDILEVVLVHSNFVNIDYRHNSRVVYTLVLNILLVQLLGISPKNVIFLNIFSSECLYIEVWRDHIFVKGYGLFNFC